MRRANDPNCRKRPRARLRGRGPHGFEKLAARREIGIGGPHDPAQSSLAAQPPTHVEKVGFHPGCAGLVEAGLDDAGGFRERGEIAAFIPGARGRTRDRGDHCDLGVLADRGADFAHERSHDIAAQVEERFQLPVAADIRQPERLGHVGRKIDVAAEIGFDVLSDTLAQRFQSMPARRRPLSAMRAEAEAELIVEPGVRTIERELVMIAVRIGQKSRRLQRQAAHRIGTGHVGGERDRVGARLRRRRTKVVDVAIAERIGDGSVGMAHSELRVVQQHEPDVDAESRLPA